MSSLALKSTEFAEAFFRVKGKPFSFDGYQFFRAAYDSSARGLVLKTGRQVAKSTTIGIKGLTWTLSIPNFSTLYVAPTENHISIFSKQKLTPLLASPFIKRRFFTANKTDQVFYKQFSNGSDYILRSCFLDPESIRGITADAVCIDELQDILVDNISVIEECYTRSDYKYTIYSGTPKTNQHATEYYWQLSNQNEWLVRCDHCNYWNYLDEGCVQPAGLSCSKCYKGIDPHENKSEWVSFDLSRKNRLEGYRISQLMVPWIPWDLAGALKVYGEDADERGTIMYKYRKYSRMRFYNEVLGLAYDDASCPVTLADLIDACDPKLKLCEDRKSGSTVVSRMILYAGIDWSTSIDTASYTILTVGGFIPGGQFVILYAKRYEGIETDLRPMLKHILQKIEDFSVRVVGVDWGSGADKNSLLRDALIPKGVQIVEFNHSGTQKADVNWNAKAKIFMINRTRILTEVFNKIKHKDIVFPCWDDMQPYLQDLLHIYSDYNEILKTVFYNHPPNKPDDYMHCLVFCHLVATLSQQS